ncbi:MAG: LpxL/LpxP family Kdo(2)-lipid IV(A) lauroyl/palmitoleoyl acyltransferase [Gammaproteobacteria bacterium]
MKDKSDSSPDYSLFAPRYWPTWLAFGLVRLVILLPYPRQLAVGRLVGRLYRLLSPYRRLIVRTNLELCFPELEKRARRQLEDRSFDSLGMALVETAAALWQSERFFDNLGTLEGLEHIESARRQGRGILLLSGHFCSLDFAGRILMKHYPTCFTYRELRNKLSDRIIRKARERRCRKLIHRHDLRTFIEALRAGEMVWYAPDQSQSKRKGVFAPFFGIPASTLKATTRLVKLTGATVLPFSIRRLPGARGYALAIQPALEHFPGENVVADATRFNAFIESEARANPEQYLWVHRRFKARPTGEAKLYPRGGRRTRK